MSKTFFSWFILSFLCWPCKLLNCEIWLVSECLLTLYSLKSRFFHCMGDHVFNTHTQSRAPRLTYLETYGFHQPLLSSWQKSWQGFKFYLANSPALRTEPLLAALPLPPSRRTPLLSLFLRVPPVCCQAKPTDRAAPAARPGPESPETNPKASGSWSTASWVCTISQKRGFLKLDGPASWELSLTAAENGQQMKMIQGLETTDIWGVLPPHWSSGGNQVPPPCQGLPHFLFPPVLTLPGVILRETGGPYLGHLLHWQRSSGEPSIPLTVPPLEASWAPLRYQLPGRSTWVLVSVVLHPVPRKRGRPASSPSLHLLWQTPPNVPWIHARFSTSAALPWSRTPSSLARTTH